MTYDAHSEQVIAGLIKQNPGINYWEFSDLLRRAYPFGSKRGEPYKSWNRVKKRTFRYLFPDIVTGRREKPQPSSGLYFETKKEMRYYKF